jgi:flagellar protein FliL
MAAKPEAKEAPEKAAPEKGASDKAAPEKAPVAVVAKFAGLKAWLPVVLAVVAAPATCWAVAEYVLLPRLQQKLAAAQSGELPDPSHAEKTADKGHAEKKKGGHGGKEEGEGGASGDTYEFSNVVVNLSGTMGTRYLKTSFVITGVKPDTIKAAFEENKARLTDVTLGVLSSLSLSDLEEPGAKNVLREKLVTAYNQALGSRVAEQVYFSDFVVQ